MINASLLILVIILINWIRQGANKKIIDDSESNWMRDENME